MAEYTVERVYPKSRWNNRTCEYETKYSKGNIHMTHEGRFITFKKEWSPKTQYKYDLVTGEFIRVKRFKTKDDVEERVQRRNAAPWFGRCDLVTDDAKWARLYYYARNLVSSCSNMSWFIDKFASTQIKLVEQWMSQGIKFEPIERMFRNGGSYYFGWREDKQILHAPNEYNKKLLNYIKSKNEERGEVTFTFINECYDHWNDGQYGVFKQIEHKIEEEPQYQPVFHSPVHDWSDYEYDILHDNSAKELRNTVIKTMQTYNLDLDAFTDYCLYLLNSESINIAKLMADYPDYLRRELMLQGGRMSRMNKYPECWLTTTHKQQKEFNNLQRLRQLEENGGSEQFNNSIEENKHLEWKNGHYMIRMPNDAEDIRDEASQMNHCVATYIPDIEAGKRIVMFMRDQEYPERSLVTVEVINGAVTQAYAKNDSHPDMACKIWLTKWAMEKGLRITAITLK